VVKCSGVLQCSDGLSNKVSNIIRRFVDNMKLFVICILRVLLSQKFSINVYVVLFLFNIVIYVFLLYECMFMYDYPE
jgi:small basic protein